MAPGLLELEQKMIRDYPFLCFYFCCFVFKEKALSYSEGDGESKCNIKVRHQNNVHSELLMCCFLDDRTLAKDGGSMLIL